MYTNIKTRHYVYILWHPKEWITIIAVRFGLNTVKLRVTRLIPHYTVTSLTPHYTVTSLTPHFTATSLTPHYTVTGLTSHYTVTSLTSHRPLENGLCLAFRRSSSHLKRSIKLKSWTESAKQWITWHITDSRSIK